ncbi:hypothetical protein [Sulfitobacter sp. 1A15299]|uniref:hypothetical protein n=1 Tax=Sulfitobacter sp. 1A15299 TaxID=3368598 RepID=UPI0037451CD2
MAEGHAQFAKRIELLGRKHRKLERGYVTRIGRDGLISVLPRRARRGFPMTGLFLIVLVFFGFKAFTLAAIGPVTYNERLSRLANGSNLEQVGAKMMAIDPVTQTLAEMTGPIMR